MLRLGPQDLISSLNISTVLILFTMLGRVLLTLLIVRISNCATNLSDKTKQKIENSRLKAVDATIMFTFFSALKFNFAAMKVVKEFQLNISSFVALFTLLVLNAASFVLARILYKNRDHLETKEKIKQFKTLIEGRNVEKAVWTYPMVFLLRRTAFICAAVFLFEKTAFQMIVHQLLSLFTLVYMLVD